MNDANKSFEKRMKTLDTEKSVQRKEFCLADSANVNHAIKKVCVRRFAEGLYQAFFSFSFARRNGNIYKAKRKKSLILGYEFI